MALMCITRVRLGERLAKEQPADADIVDDGLCVAYFTGQYPAPLDDCAFALDKEVASLKVSVAEVSA